MNIPDANFKAKLLSASSDNDIASTIEPTASGYVSTYDKIDINNDGEIQVSEASAIKYLKVQYFGIVSLTGIESFTNLKVLICAYNQLQNLNLNGLANLKILNCDTNQLI